MRRDDRVAPAASTRIRGRRTRRARDDRDLATFEGTFSCTRYLRLGSAALVVNASSARSAPHGVANGPQRHVAHRHRLRLARGLTCRPPRSAAGAGPSVMVPFGVGPDVPSTSGGRGSAPRRGLSVVGDGRGSPALFAVLAGDTTCACAVDRRLVRGRVRRRDRRGAADARPGARADHRRTPRGRAAWVLAGPLAGLFLGATAPRLSREPRVRRARSSGRRRLAARHVAGRPGRPRSLWRRRPRASAVLPDRGARARGVAAWSLARRRERGWRSDAGHVRPSRRRRRAIVAGGLLAMAIGPARLAVDTSKDAFLRRAGLTDAVRHAYLDRALHRWTRYVQWLALPLAALGLMRTSGFAGGCSRRGRRSWSSAPVGLSTGWFPADRLVTFGFSIPAPRGSRRGLVWLWLERRIVLATIVAAALVGLMAAGALISWSRQQPFVSPLEVARVTTAARIAQTLPAGTPLVFIVDDADATVSFLATRAANVHPRRDAPGPRRRRVRLRRHARNFLAGRAHHPRRARVRRDVPPLSPRHPAGSPTAARRVRPGAVQPNARRDVGDSDAVPLEPWGVRVDPRVLAPLRPPGDPLEPSSPAQIALGGVRPPRADGHRGLRLGAMGGSRRCLRRPPSRPRSAWRRLRSAASRRNRSVYRSRELWARRSSRCSPAGPGTLLLVLQGKPSAPPPPPVEEQPAE